MPVRLTEKSRVVVELPLMMFLRLADGDGKMTAREMERFDELLGARDWCRSTLLRRSLANTEAERPALWKRYVAGEFHVGIDQVAASLDTVLGSVGVGERRDVEHDLLHFCRELLRAARGAAGALHRDTQAEAEFEALLDLILRPSARTAPTEIQVEPKGEARDSGSLLVGDVSAEMFWRRGKLQLQCIQVTDETHNVKTFRFVASPPKLFRYLPGQFVTLEVPVDGKVVRRSYTISTSPSRPHVIAVTVKRAEGGQISSWLHDHLQVGSTLFVDGPHGKFTCVGDGGGPYLFISAGSGITPIMAMLRWLCDTAPDADIRFLHFARTPSDLIFEPEVKLMERQLPNLRCEFVCSRTGDGNGYLGRVGRISTELLTAFVPDLRSRCVYLCGPVAFMEATRGILERLGFDMGRFRQESFGSVPRDSRAAEARPSRPAKVIFAASKIEVDCTTSDYVLDLALATGVPAAFSCRAGQCGTCKMMVLEGSVEHDCADGLTEDDTKDGLILSCQARPLGRIVIDL